VDLLVGYGCLVIAFVFFSINFLGVVRNIRPAHIDSNDLRFTKNFKFSYSQAILSIQKLHGESDSAYAQRQTIGISKSFAHIKWNEIQDASKYNQLVPFSENWVLYLMGKLSGIDEYKKYHFTNYFRSLKRGIGICGDASMIMSQVLHIQKIKNNIIAFPHHVTIQIILNDDNEMLLDPDFGVVVPLPLLTISRNPRMVAKYYLSAGYPASEVTDLVKFYGEPYTVWRDVKHFVRKKYYFEKCSYAIVWATPLVMTIISVYILFL
jgi:hypothetical protein